MKNNQLMGAALIAMTCLAGTAAAQDFGDRRGPNVMPAPRSSDNYSNNTNTYNPPAIQSQRGPNSMQPSESLAQMRPTPRTERAPAAAPTENEAQAAPGARQPGTGPNINGEASRMPSESARSGRRGDAIPGCDKCVAI